MKTTKLHLLILATVLALTAPTRAFTFRQLSSGTKVKWPADTVVMRVYTGSFPPVGQRRVALEEAVLRWNDNPSKFQFSLEYGDLSSGRQNEIWFTDADGLLDGRSGVTFCWRHHGDLVEADIILADWDDYWTTSHDPSLNFAYGGPRMPMQTAMLHELGHALGLLHEDDEYNVMGTDWNHVNAHADATHYYAGEDACDGAVSLYGLDSSHREDVSVTHWRYRDSDGEYSVHYRTRVYKTDGTEAEVVTGSVRDDRTYYVTMGHHVRVQFTYENSGASDQSPLVKYYLSTDDAWDTGDRLLGSNSPSLSRNSVFTPGASDCMEILIPTDLVAGRTYYILAVMDPDHAITEVNESNNVSYIRVQIK